MYLSFEKSIKQHLNTISSFAETMFANRRKEHDDEERGDLVSRFMRAKNVRGEALNDNVILHFKLSHCWKGRYS
jgi:cytochrome P450